MPHPRRPLIAALVIVLAAVAPACGGGGDQTPEGILDRQTFRCFGVSESARTVAASRIDHKKVQLRRMRRLLDAHKLEGLDDAKIKAEYAITMWDAEDARFLQACAEAYFRPGSAHLRPTFDDAPVPTAFRPGEPRAAFQTALDTVEPRHLPHGFEERARLHLAESALILKDYDKARSLASDYLEANPTTLYRDTFQLVAADAALALGDADAAIALYKDVGRLKIGLDSHYARYRLAMIHKARGEDDEADTLINEVLQWADRGDREALAWLLRGQQPAPPMPR